MLRRQNFRANIYWIFRVINIGEFCLQMNLELNKQEVKDLLDEKKIRRIAKYFPNLINNHCKIIHPLSRHYNCISWTVNDQKKWWWPDQDRLHYWPDEAIRDESIEAFIQFYGLMGYVVCENGSTEEEFEKISIYIVNGKPIHAARQLNNGKWSSKIGGFEVIEHTLEALTGSEFGVTLKKLLILGVVVGIKVFRIF